MKKELEEKMVNDFPDLYRDYGGPASKTCMCWGFECGDGWFDILYELSKKLSDADPECIALQVKEKFGLLRYYTNHATDETENLIREAERKSSETCEECGEPGELRKGGWLRTLCDKCGKEYLEDSTSYMNNESNVS